MMTSYHHKVLYGGNFVEGFHDHVNNFSVMVAEEELSIGRVEALGLTAET